MNFLVDARPFCCFLDDLLNSSGREFSMAVALKDIAGQTGGNER